LGKRRVDFVERDDFARAYRKPPEFSLPSRKA